VRVVWKGTLITSGERPGLFSSLAYSVGVDVLVEKFHTCLIRDVHFGATGLE